MGETECTVNEGGDQQWKVGGEARGNEVEMVSGWVSEGENKVKDGHQNDIVVESIGIGRVRLLDFSECSMIST